MKLSELLMKTYRFSALILMAFSSFLPAAELQLEEAWRIALANSPTEDVARSRLKQAEAQLGQNRSFLQPRLDSFVSGARIEVRDNAAERSGEGFESYEAGLEASWLLYSGGARDSRIQASLLRRDVAESEQRDSRLTFLTQVAQAFTAAQLFREDIRIAKADAAFQARQSADARRRETAGVASREDRLNFDLRRVEAETSVLQAKARYDQAVATLSALLGSQALEKDRPAPASLRKESDVNPSPEIEAAWKITQESLPALRSARARVRAAEQQSFLRDLELQAEASLSRASTQYNVSIQAETLTRQSLEISRENRDLVERSYAAGQESLIRLNEAQRDFTRAESRAARARLSRELSWIELQRAMGTLLSDFSITTP